MDVQYLGQLGHSCPDVVCCVFVFVLLAQHTLPPAVIESGSVCSVVLLRMASGLFLL